MPKHRRLILPERVCELRYACIPSLTESPQRCYIEHPVSPRNPQACLIVASHPKGSEEWFAGLVVLPRDAKYEIVPTIHVHAAALALIKLVFRATITRASGGKRYKDGIFDYITAGYQESPFVCADRIVAEDPTLRYWSPILLRHGFDKLWGQEKWSILQRWEQWNRDSVSIKDRATGFYKIHHLESRSERLQRAKVWLNGIQIDEERKLNRDDRNRYRHDGKVGDRAERLSTEDFYDESQASRKIAKAKITVECLERSLMIADFVQHLFYLRLPASERQLTGVPKAKEGYKQRRLRRLMEN